MKSATIIPLISLIRPIPPLKESVRTRSPFSSKRKSLKQWPWPAARYPEPNVRVTSIGSSPDMPVPLASAALQAREEIQMDLVSRTLRQFGQVRLIARGCSMIPYVCPGDLLTVRSIGHSSVAVADIVLSSREGRFYVHRLLRSWSEGDRSYFQTKGDALRQPDPVASADQMLGRVTTIERHGKQIDTRVRVGNSCLAAVVSRSEFCAKLFLHCHSARMRFYSRTTLTGDTAFRNLAESL